MYGTGVTQERRDEAELWRRFLAGDREAVAALYDRHAAAAYGLAVHMVGPAAAEDVVHDSFVVVLANGAAFDPALGAFRPWLLRVVHNRCANLLRRQRAGDEDELQHIQDPADEPAEKAISTLAGGEVRAALSELPAEQQEAISLAFFGGLTHAELAERLNVPLGTAKARVRRGLLALRERLRAKGAEALP